MFCHVCVAQPFAMVHMCVPHVPLLHVSPAPSQSLQRGHATVPYKSPYNPLVTERICGQMPQRKCEFPGKCDFRNLNSLANNIYIYDVLDEADLGPSGSSSADL